MPVMASPDSDAFARWRVRMRNSPSGPPMREPATRPKVAAAIVMAGAPTSPISSRTGEKPPAVPWPPLIGMEPAAMPSSGFRCIPFAMPTARRFWSAMRTATRPIITRRGFPPCLSTRTSDWKPTEVKKSIIAMSLIVPSNVKFIPKMACRSRMKSDTASPPDTGAGMQNRLSQGNRRVKRTPRKRAVMPVPAVIYISSETSISPKILIFLYI